MIPHNSLGIQLAVENLGERRRKGKFSVEDVVVPVKEHESARLGDKLEALWDERVKLGKNPLILVLVKMFGVEFALYGLLYFPLDLAVWWVQTQLVTTNSQKISVSFHQYI
jgi:hypothetical protein